MVHIITQKYTHTDILVYYKLLYLYSYREVLQDMLHIIVNRKKEKNVQKKLKYKLQYSSFLSQHNETFILIINCLSIVILHIRGGGEIENKIIKLTIIFQQYYIHLLLAKE